MSRHNNLILLNRDLEDFSLLFMWITIGGRTIEQFIICNYQPLKNYSKPNKIKLSNNKSLNNSRSIYQDSKNYWIILFYFFCCIFENPRLPCALDKQATCECLFQGVCMMFIFYARLEQVQIGLRNSLCC